MPSEGFTYQYWNGTTWIDIVNVGYINSDDSFAYKSPNTITTDKLRMNNCIGLSLLGTPIIEAWYTELEVYKSESLDITPTAISNPILGINGLCAGNHPLSVTISNHSSQLINTFEYHLEINNVIVGLYTIATSIAPFSSANLYLSQIDLLLGYNQVKIITSKPNGLNDQRIQNDTLLVHLNTSELPINPTPLPDTFICTNSTIVFDLGNHPNYDYYWSNGEQTQTANITQPGTYTVFAHNNTGCEYRDTFIVNEAPQIRTNGILSIIQESDYTFLFDINNIENATIVEWNFGDNAPLEYGLGPKRHTYQDTGHYTPIVRLMNDCDTVILTQPVYVKDNNTAVSQINKSILNIYPNPAKGILYIDNKTAIKIDQIEIYNNIGQRVECRNEHNTINIKNLSIGNYILIIKSSDQIYTTRFNKE